MARRTPAALAAGVAGIFLLVLGILHIAFGTPALQRAVERGDLAPQLAGPQMVNWLFSGGAISLFGILLLSSIPDLRRGRRSTWRIVLLIGVFFFVVGIGAYFWVSRVPVLVFSVAGVFICGPLLAAEREFSETGTWFSRYGISPLAGWPGSS
jgi:hypothetical protein